MRIELCVRAIDKPGKDKRQDAGLGFAGDVISARIEEPAKLGEWGTSVDNDPQWRSFLVDIPVTLVESLMAKEPGEFIDRGPRKRRSSLNLNHPVIKNAMSDDVSEITDLTGLDITPAVILKGSM